MKTDRFAVAGKNIGSYIQHTSNECNVLHSQRHEEPNSEVSGVTGTWGEALKQIQRAIKSFLFLQFTVLHVLYTRNVIPQLATGYCRLLRTNWHKTRPNNKRERVNKHTAVMLLTRYPARNSAGLLVTMTETFLVFPQPL